MRRLAHSLLLALLLAAPVLAFPGDSAAINGAECWWSGALPPPGFHYINYTLYYFADDFKDGDGDTYVTPPFADFEAHVAANVFRPIYVADLNILGATPAWHMVIPVLYKSLESDFIDDDVFGLSDVYFSPLILGWHSKNVHGVVGLDIIAPIGTYDEDDVANVGVNHWTFELAGALTVMSNDGWSGSMKLMYDIHTENDDTDILTGQQIHGDWNVGYSADEWRAGLSGYFLKGVQDDEVNGVEVPDSKEQVVAVGPSIQWHRGPLAVIVRSQWEFAVENRPQGVSNWLKVIYSF